MVTWHAGPSQTALLGVGAVVVAGAAAFLVAGKQGELPDVKTIESAAQSE